MLTSATFSVNLRFTSALKSGTAAAPDIMDRGIAIDSSDGPPREPKPDRFSALCSADFLLLLFDSFNSVSIFGSEIARVFSSRFCITSGMKN